MNRKKLNALLKRLKQLQGRKARDLAKAAGVAGSLVSDLRHGVVLYDRDNARHVSVYAMAKRWADETSKAGVDGSSKGEVD